MKLNAVLLIQKDGLGDYGEAVRISAYQTFQLAYEAMEDALRSAMRRCGRDTRLSDSRTAEGRLYWFLLKESEEKYLFEAWLSQPDVEGDADPCVSCCALRLKGNASR